MSYSSLQGWTDALLSSVTDFNKKNEFYTPYDYVINFQNNTQNINSKFEKALLDVINYYELYNFKSYWQEHFFVIRLAVIINQNLKHHYTVTGLPFGDDQQKYKQQEQTKIKRLKKSGKQEKAPISPKDNIGFFQVHCDELLSSYEFSTEKRYGDKLKHELISELIDAITIDNYFKNVQNKKLRVSTQKKEHYKKEVKRYKSSKLG